MHIHDHRELELLPSQNHISYQAQEKVRKLIAPLLKLGNIHYFCYRVQYADNSFFSLLTHANYFESWFTHQFPLCGHCFKDGWHLWDPHLPKVDISQELGIGNGVCHINHQSNKTEIFSFATDPENAKVFDFYLNEQNLLKKFMNYFMLNASDIIQEAQHQLLQPLPQMVMKNDDYHESISCQPSDVFLTDFHQDLNYPFSALSKREAECCQMLLKGFSHKEISHQLQLAPSTVDVYVGRVKRKLDSPTRKELIDKALKQGLVENHLWEIG